MTDYIFDIETNGIEATKIHCLAMIDIDTEEVFVYNDQGNRESITTGLNYLAEADMLVGHNIIMYDLPVIKRLYPFFEFKKKCVRDTLVLSYLLFPDLKERDARRSLSPEKFIGSHSLEAWGIRLGEKKGEFKYTEDAFEKWTPELEDYCVQDLKVNFALWRYLERTWNRR